MIPADPPTASIADVARDNDVLLCCGTGGVGKTTVAAALALGAANAGRKVVVVTIDPARRLADALGLRGISNDCVRVDGTGPGELWVTMLDTKATFDRLIERYAADDAQATRILENRYYRNLSTTLSGTREFMAMERLYELHHDERFDLVVVDTPPSRNALDFLDAPDKLARFLDGRLFRLAAPGRKMTRKVTAPFIVFLRRVARVVSPEVVDDTLAFIEAFGGMEEGFRERAAAVDALMGSADTAFVLVAAPTAETIEETTFFAERLRSADLPVGALVLNRLQPRFGPPSAAWPDDVTSLSSAARAQLEVLEHLTALSDAEDAELMPLIELCSQAALARIHQLDHDVHDLEGIAEITERLDNW